MTTTNDISPLRWARVWATARPFARPMPRAGAWYPVVGEASGDRVVLRVRDKRVAIQKNLVEFRNEQPRAFTFVIRPRSSAAQQGDAAGKAFERVYAVCPDCATRVRVLEGQTKATCPKCGHSDDVAWWETG